MLLDQTRRAGKNLLAIVGVIPIGIGVRVTPAGRCLADLAWAADKDHLPMLSQMLD